MSSGFQASQAKDSRGGVPADEMPHTVTLDRALFEKIRTFAMANGRSISEEMAVRLAASIKQESTEA